RKKALPLLPEKIAVVTSPSGAALRDILQVLGRRNSSVQVVILPAAVQGQDAARQIAEQITRADRYKLGEVIIVGRGGGALEDLLPFSDELVVRAISAAETPVISAVGHEIDFALSDFAADVRAPTPSAAAELVSARREEVLGAVQTLHDQLIYAMQERLARIRQLTTQFRSENLEREIRIRLQPVLLRLDDQKEALLYNMRLLVRQTRQRTETLCRELEAVSPAKVLARGYSVVSLEKNGKIISDQSAAAGGDRLDITLARGKLKARVEEKQAEEQL
ncbi:MAG: exodeoxyribonuclease VII large subunit, partial [Spirochaetales bacterium]|nr:exodeoxyribonuclease VII large subunit [Spirochaetales bacterium]